MTTPQDTQDQPFDGEYNGMRDTVVRIVGDSLRVEREPFVLRTRQRLDEFSSPSVWMTTMPDDPDRDWLSGELKRITAERDSYLAVVQAARAAVDDARDDWRGDPWLTLIAAVDALGPAVPLREESTDAE